ncbi:hypothetical protein [Mesorhizobium sp. B2-4-6]|uniref:hypothetical protein n=1 Tax=Mesorhizobium sp. B2-4-6 TaxID=2589943 RepID=UPI00112B5831|nr:hypothetical protein [Mesorhizobium sp. B2-4-6]TPL40654.1 hypothetical protein FJ957_25835 [Mesorhizobium sp. B2-4-6]
MPRHPETLQEHRRRRAYTAALESVDRVETTFDRAVNCLAEHPRLTCAIVVVSVLAACCLDAPR